MVTMIKVESQNVDSYGYDQQKRELYVRFKNDGKRLYCYVRVPRLVWTCFQKAGSKKQFLDEYVIPYFHVTQVTEQTLTHTSMTSTPRERNPVTG